MVERITTAGVLFRGDEVFVGKRMKGGAIGEMWEFPGGKNRYGETPEKTLQREWMEELNLTIDVGRLICTHEFVNKGTLYHLKAFVVTCPDLTAMKLLFHTDVKFVPVQKLDLLHFAPSDKRIVDALTAQD